MTAVLEVSAVVVPANAPLIALLNPLNASSLSAVLTELELLANLVLLMTLLARTPTSNAKTVSVKRVKDVLEPPTITSLAQISMTVLLMFVSMELVPPV
jgi:hypothetical protein